MEAENVSLTHEEKDKLNKKGDILVSGHTHIQVLEKKDGMIWLNPGSISFPKGGNEASYATIEDNFITIRKVVDASPIKELSID